uniref:PGG domain-containing protein n=1 Tax=Davidia involucrata TaxID=16924 RepID=A0A5B6YN64_DAVIN
MSGTGFSMSMKPAIYRAALGGDIDGLRGALDDPEPSLIKQVSPRGNTILHLAASGGHDHLVEAILSRCPDHFKSKNSTGDLPLHLAASAGHLSTVQSLISNATKYFASSTSGNSSSEAREKEIKELLKEANEEGNTPLHLALKNRHYNVAVFLFNENQEASGYVNIEEKSPLYMATEAGYLELVMLMMEFIVKSENPDVWLQGESIVHAAIRTRNKELLDKLLSYRPSLMDSNDENGTTPLSYAASIGYLEGVCYILEGFVECTYRSDGNGLYPIHMASSKGHINIIQEFLQCCPDSRELLNRQGQNILHIAAENGKADAISYMLKVPELENLINERDDGGNTALHLATRKVHPKVVSILTWDQRVSLELLNGSGMTALDGAEALWGSMPSFQQRLTLQALRYANVPHASNPKTQRSSSNQSLEYYKDRVNTLLLVATLVATVTFAAGFTMPGGYNSSDNPNKGMATMFEKHTFHVFLISDTIAMFSSILVAVVLIWAQLGDVSLIIAALKLALPLLGIALTMVSSAFMAGVYLVVSNLTWLANFILIMGSLFLLTLLLLFVPLVLPYSLTHPMQRYIFYYPFYLLLLVTQNDAEDNSTKYVALGAAR